jgi:hypothetical protein
MSIRQAGELGVHSTQCKCWMLQQCNSEVNSIESVTCRPNLGKLKLKYEICPENESLNPDYK